jgi:predicted nucleotidyltransferase
VESALPSPSPPKTIASLPFTETERLTLDELSRTVRTRFGERLRELTLFGSRARGGGASDSDFDVAIVVDSLTGAEGREMGWLAGDLLTKYAVLVSPFAVSAEHMNLLRSRERLIAAEIARDGVHL